MTTLGEALVQALEARGVTTVFGIPGVHTIELYRGLAGSGIRHVNPRHEQGAGFMADGYARVSGKPGVAFVITGPGVTNMLTPMGQALADSVPMLVLSGVNRSDTLGKGLGHLHELPDQLALVAGVARSAERIETAAQLAPALDRAFDGFTSARPGPAHIEIPLDVMPVAAAPIAPVIPAEPPQPKPDDISRAAQMLAGAKAPLILVGGGAKRAGTAIVALAEKLGAPVVQTINARGLMYGHPLGIPASPSLRAVRDLIGASDMVLAAGTELGPTDYDLFFNDDAPLPKPMIRIDLSREQLNRHAAELTLCGAAGRTIAAITAALDGPISGQGGSARAKATRDAARAELSVSDQAQLALIEAIRDTLPGAIIVGDSSQAIYAANLYYDHDRPCGWFNAATGFGALGYGIPAAIGAALAAPDAPVVCVTGDGGAQFTLPELMTAVDENLPIAFLVWNNHAYREIALAMEATDITVIGCHPTPPDFGAIASACTMPYQRIAMTPAALSEALRNAAPKNGPVMIEIDAK